MDNLGFQELIDSHLYDDEKKRISNEFRKNGGCIHLDISFSKVYCSVNGKIIIDRPSFYQVLMEGIVVNA